MQTLLHLRQKDASTRVGEAHRALTERTTAEKQQMLVSLCGPAPGIAASTVPKFSTIFHGRFQTDFNTSIAFGVQLYATAPGMVRDG